MEPTRYQTHELIKGAVWISLSRIFIPLGSVYWLNVFFMGYLLMTCLQDELVNNSIDYKRRG